MIEHGCSKYIRLCAGIGLLLAAAPSHALAQASSPSNPRPGLNPRAGLNPPIQSSLISHMPDLREVLAGDSPDASAKAGTSGSLQILVLLTALTLIPAALVTMTCFTRIIVVLALLRQALATPQLPPGQVLLGLSLFLTLMVMAPTFHRVNQDALTPYLNNEVSQERAIQSAMGHLRGFMYEQIDEADNEEDIYLFLEYTEHRIIPASESVTLESVPTTVLVPAFILSELKTAFLIGFRIYLPFLVIDMVISVLLVSMGMMMLPPVLISLPFKLMLFVVADGWNLVVKSLVESFH